MRPFVVGFFILFAGLSIGILSVEAQGNDLCPAFVEQAIVEVGDICANLGRNVACYGHDNLETTFYPSTDISRFELPADRIDLTSLNTIQTAALNEAEERWGIALISAQANLPGTIPGQNVVMMLVGDASIENQVTAEQQVTTTETVEVTLRYNANMRNQPSINANVLEVVAAGTTLQADMMSEDGIWFRIPQSGGAVQWVNRDVLIENAEMATLPNPAPTQMSPMQAFYFNAAVGQAGCTEASGTLFIQGPNNIRVDLQVNGIEVSIGSTIALSFVNPTQMQVATLSGTGYVAGVTVPAGYYVSVEVDENRNGLPETVTVPQLMDEAIIARYALSEAIPANLLHYQIQMLSVEEIAAQASAIASASANASASQVTNSVDTITSVTGAVEETTVESVVTSVNVSVDPVTTVNTNPLGQ